MKSYELMLEEAYKKVKVVEKSRERFEVPKIKGFIEGKNTIITNLFDIADYIRRPIAHISKFLMKQLATSGKIEEKRLILNTKINLEKISEKIDVYVKEFVICKECGKPDTELISEKGIKFKHCLACGAKSPVISKF